MWQIGGIRIKAFATFKNSDVCQSIWFSFSQRMLSRLSVFFRDIFKIKPFPILYSNWFAAMLYVNNLNGNINLTSDVCNYKK